MSEVVCTSGPALKTDQVCTNARTPEEQTCSGCGLNSVSELYDTWTDSSLNCQRVFHDVLYDEQNNYLPDELSHLNENMLHLMIDKYKTQFGCSFTLDENDAECIRFRNVMLGVCQSRNPLEAVPGICDNFLCNFECPQHTYDDFGTDPSILDWCGCYIPPSDEVAQAITKNVAGAVSTDCDPDTPTNKVGAFPCFPLCHNLTTIQLYDNTDGCKFQCDSNVCVIDDTTIEAINSEFGTVTIEQVCPFCATGVSTCECIVASPDISGTLDDLDIQTDFNQYCGQNSVCYVIDDTGNLTPVQCSQFVTDPDQLNFTTVLPWVFLIVVVIFVVVIFIALLTSRGNTSYKKVETKDGKTKVSDYDPDDPNELVSKF